MIWIDAANLPEWLRAACPGQPERLPKYAGVSNYSRTGFYAGQNDSIFADASLQIPPGYCSRAGSWMMPPPVIALGPHSMIILQPFAFTIHSSIQAGGDFSRPSNSNVNVDESRSTALTLSAITTVSEAG
ncbi:hypothetical protein ENSA7_36940 [Enhygromyxa salina]|uniref:Uncharacterized protein n=1 Tax=Enhygromyxa salina TaxID=215803 RepID=A0A2S9YNC9_9BACT|nr:hypothetical protein ENSA7_36940 [Enhygromyxa salina]